MSAREARVLIGETHSHLAGFREAVALNMALDDRDETCGSMLQLIYQLILYLFPSFALLSEMSVMLATATVHRSSTYSWFPPKLVRHGN